MQQCYKLYHCETVSYLANNDMILLQLWCSFDDFTSGANVLVVRLIENGGIDVCNAHYSVTNSAVLYSCYYAIFCPLC